MKLIFLILFVFSQGAFSQEFPPDIYTLRIINGIDGQPFAVVWESAHGFSMRIIDPKLAENFEKQILSPTKVVTKTGNVTEISNLSAADSTVLGALLYETGHTIYNLGTRKWDGGYIQEGACKAGIGSCPASVTSLKILLQRIKGTIQESTHETYIAHRLDQISCPQKALLAYGQERQELSHSPGFIDAHPGLCNFQCGLVAEFKDDESVSSFNQMGMPSHPAKNKFKVKISKGDYVTVCSEKVISLENKISPKNSRTIERGP